MIDSESRHLATRGNNKILRTPPPYIISSEKIVLISLCRTLAQFITNKSPFLKSYIQKVDNKLHPSPLSPLCNTHTHNTHILLNCIHIRTTFHFHPWICGQTPNHIHRFIVSRLLDTRSHNKILRTPPPHISSSEEILPYLIRRTLAQLRTNKSPFLRSYLHKVDAKSHPSPLCPLCNSHIRNTHHLFNCAHIRTTFHFHPWMCGQTPPE